MPLGSGTTQSVATSWGDSNGLSQGMLKVWPKMPLGAAWPVLRSSMNMICA